MRAKKVIVIEYKSHQIKKAVTELCTNRDKEGPCEHMADVAELKDLAWENQWAVVSRRTEPLSSPWLPGSCGLNQSDFPTTWA